MFYKVDMSFIIFELNPGHQSEYRKNTDYGPDSGFYGRLINHNNAGFCQAI